MHPQLQAVIDELGRRQAEQVALVRRTDGLPLDRPRITSPFNARVRYNVYAALTILPRHQHRHLWQAEQVRAELPSGDTPGGSRRRRLE